MLLRLAVVAAVACALVAANDDTKPDCLQAGDGYYTKGCSHKFWRCVNDRLYSYDCPRGLYFNPLKRKCEYKADVPICADGVKVDSKNVIKASAEFNCTGLEDGPYKPRDIACSNTFITCFNGMAVEQACPYGQYFHENNKRCDYKDNVPGCLKTESGSKIGGSIGASCPALRTGHVDIPCDADETCQAIERPVDGRYLCPKPFAVWYGPLGTFNSDQWVLAPEGLICGEDGRWYNGNTIVETPAVDCTAKRSSLSRDAPAYGAAPAQPQRSPTLTLNQKAAALNACPGLFTGKDSEGIPCDGDEVCQAIQRPKNGRYTCEAPFMVYYGPVRGASAQWKMAKDGLMCGADGFWYDSGVKIDASGIDCTAKKVDFTMKDDETLGCPSLSTNEREIPCTGDEEVCQPILKAVAGKYACATPYRVWYGPRGGAESAWKQAKDALICKGGSWFDGDVKIDASAVDCTVKKIDCRKLGDGTYNGEPGRCSTHFWQCSNEAAYLYPCPPGLFFDDFSKTCDFKEVVESCGGARRAPSATTTTAAPHPAADVARKTDCSTVLTDSSLPCRSDEACVAPVDPVNGKYLCETPYTLSFGPKANVNLWRQAPNGIQCKNGQWFNGEEQIAPEAVHCTTAKFACAGKKDGSYSAHPEKCTAYFWNCAHDDSFLYTCPAGLFFDIDALKCDYKEVITACGGVKKDEPSKIVIPSNDSPAPLFDCTGKDNGYHETGKCQEKFWNCADGKSFQIDCPAGLVYDGRVQLCQYPVACTADLPATTTPPPAPSTLDHGDISKIPPAPTTSFDCSMQKDGLYAEKKCHKQYVECSNGRTFVKECPAGLVFASFSLACDYKQVCMNPPTTAAPSTTPAAAPAATTYSSYATYERIPATTKAPIAPPTFDVPNCANLEDGAHAMSRCGLEFFMCWHGEASFSKCNDGLVFNPLNSQCDYRSNVIECGPAADATTAAPGMPAPPSPPSTTASPDLFCEGRADGHFGSGCQSYFYSCQNGATTKMFCPVGLHYDADSKTCDMRELIVACGGEKESTTTPAADAPISPYQRVQPVAPVKDTPILPPNRFCAGKADGFYSEGCQTFFYNCQNGMTYKMNCPTDLFYDSDRKACDRKEDIVACGAVPSTLAPTTPASAPANTYQRVQPTAPVKDVQVVALDKFCVGKVDGFYAAPGCQPFFYSCQNGNTHQMACPSGLFYDSIKKACDNREDIIACGAAPPLATQAPLVTPASTLAPYQTVAPVRDIPVAPIDNSCIGKEDGFYAAPGCQTFFYSCQNGVAYKMDCPSGLFYDGLQKKCDHRFDIVACGAAPAATQPPATTQAPATTPAAAPASPYQVPTAAPVRDVPIEKFCVGKDDAFYGEGCQSFFYSCQSGITHKMACPSGLFYDFENKKCDNKEEIVACGGTATTQTPITKAADVPAVVVENFCNGKVDGFYTFGCQSFFYSCQSGSTYKMTCPSGLFYDVAQKKCNFREEIPDCGAPAQTTPAAAPAATTTQAPAPYPTKAAEIPVTITANFCAGKADAVYGSGCQNFFYTCQSGTTCSSGLFFDVDTKQCNYREFIVACGGKKEEIAPVTAAPVAPVSLDRPVAGLENFCLTKEDGFYGDGCQPHFISCQGGAAYKMNCPAGLYYDLSRKACDHKEEIVACGGTNTPTIALAPVSPYGTPATAAPSRDQQPIPLIMSENFCGGKADGFYSNGCAEFFFSCQNGNTHKMGCPTGLFYDAHKKACDRREYIVECGGVAPVAPVTPAAAPAVHPYARPAQSVLPMATVAPVRDLVPVATTDNFCTGKTNGIYSNGCEAFYLSCQNGFTYKMACPAGLFYDVTSSLCDMKENIVACGGKKPVVAPVAPLVRDQPAPPADYFCKGKVDGTYGNGCESYFYSCMSGYTYKMLCNSGLFYDASKKACNRREEIAGCGALPVAPVAPVAPAAAVPQSQYSSAPAPPPSVAAAPAVAVVHADTFCTGKSDGIYTVEGCPSFYYSCSNGYTYKMACPANLFYDVSSKQCDRRENVVACGGVQPAPVQPAAAPAATAAPYAQPAAAPAATVAPAYSAQPAAAPAVSVVHTETFCTGKTDGIYTTEGCPSFYYSCSNGYTYKMACPTNLFYDVSSKQCDRRENVVACGGVQPAAAPAAPAYGQPAPVQPTPAAAPAVSIPTVEKFCTGKTDGIYTTEGCPSFYYSCSNGYTYKMACPSGLFFDVSTKQCDVREKIVSCGGSAPAAAPAAPTYGQPVQPTPAAAPAVSIPTVEKFCTGKTDGIYTTEGCPSFYYSCSNGYTYKMACPSGLFFDVSSKQCDVREKIVACGGSPIQPTPAAAPASPAYSKPAAAPAAPTYGQPAPAQPTPAAAPAVAVVTVEKFCTGKPDGIYAEGCISTYFNCANGYTFKMACPSGLFFDVSSKQCDVRENIVACGGQKPLQAQPQNQYQPAPVQPTPAAAPAVPVATVEKFCTGKVDGIYAEGCPTFYFNCVSGYTYKMACPSGLFYDVSTKQCDRRENIVACGGLKPQLAQPQNQYQPAPVAPLRDVAPISTFCIGKADGFYGEGCQNFFHSCSNGQVCGTGLFFDISSKQCDYREKIVACGGQQPAAAPAATAAPYGKPATSPPVAPPSAYSQPASPAKDKPVLKNVNDKSCTGQANGYYGEGCQSHFFTCLDGSAYKMACPTGLFYDLELQSCQYKDDVPNCGGRRPVVVATPAPALDNLRPAPTNSAQCNGKVDGHYPASDCSQEFIACQSGLVRKEACQAGLIYNEVNKMCDYRENVAKCGARDTLPTRAPAADYGRSPSRPIARPSGNKYDSHKEEQMKKPALAPSDYPLITIKIRRRIPRQTRFSTSASHEDLSDRHSPPDPFNSPPPTLPPSTPHHHRPRMGAKKALALILVAAPICQALTAISYTTFSKPLCTLEQIWSSCNAMADGYYSNGCSQDYLACIEGRPMTMTCPAGLRYSASSQMCDYSDNVPECGGSVPVLKDVQPQILPRPVITTTPSPVARITPYQKTTPAQAPAKEVHPRCAGRSDGIYALAPCSQNYLACVDEKATIGICREDLHYSTVSGLCDWKEKIPACNMLVRPTPVTTRSVPTPVPTTPAPIRDVRPIGERLNRPTVPLGIQPDCSQIADGVYAVNSCSAYYTRCKDGRLYARGTCPKGTVFSPAGASCVARSALASCTLPIVAPATPAPLATQAPALAPAQPNYGVQQAQQQQPIYQQQQQQQQPVYGGQQQMQQPTYTQQYAPSYNTYSSGQSSTYASGVYADPSQFCYGKGDGIYGNTCQKSYVICTRGATFAFQCPGEFIFSRERAVCDHPSRMTQCGGPTYGYTPAASYGYQQQQPQYGYQQQQQQSYSPY